MDLVFTSTDNPVKNNLFRIAQIRNKATHTILPEYDFIFTSLFQQCISNYNRFFNNQFVKFPLNKDVTGFVSLSQVPTKNKSPLSLNAKALLQLEAVVAAVASDSTITQTVRLQSVKKDADVTYAIVKDADEKVKMIAVTKNHEILYPYLTREIVKKIKESIELTLGLNHGFTEPIFHRICKQHKIKENTTYCHSYAHSKTTLYRYSDATIDYISTIYINE